MPFDASDKPEVYPALGKDVRAEMRRVAVLCDVCLVCGEISDWSVGMGLNTVEDQTFHMLRPGIDMPRVDEVLEFIKRRIPEHYDRNIREMGVEERRAIFGLVSRQAREQADHHGKLANQGARKTYAWENWAGSAA